MSYPALERRLGVSLPCTPGWSAEADFLQLLADHCLQYKPDIIVECGSGASTVLLARCCQLNHHGRVVSLEHEAEYAAATRQAIANQGLQDYAQVLHAPLVPYSLHGENHDWYSLVGLNAQDVEFVVIDGPPAWQSPLARYPALPLLLDRLAAHCVLMLDDAARPGEQETAQQWAERYPQFGQRYLQNTRGCVVLERVY